MRIAFLINSIGSGGAETALFNVINYRNVEISSKVDIHLVILDDEPIHRPIPNCVTVHQLNAKRSLLRSILSVRRTLKEIRPCLTVSFLVRANLVNSILRCTNDTGKSIICERMHLSSHMVINHNWLIQFVSKKLFSIFYPYSDLILGVSSGVTEDLRFSLGLDPDKLRTIYNPYDIEYLRRMSEKEAQALPKRYIVNIGRLTKSKDQETLIRAFASVKTDYDLLILGTGEIEESLKNLANELDVNKSVHFLGYRSNPFSILRSADFYISTSLNEGFPNAMMESMCIGVPVASSACDSGPAEIAGERFDYKPSKLHNAKYAVLFPERSVSEVATLLKKINIDRAFCQHYKKMSVIRSKDFEVHKIAKEYWDTFFSIL